MFLISSDWKAAELGDFGLNVTTMYLTLMSKLGLVYDLKEPSADLIRRTIENHGKIDQNFIKKKFTYGFLQVTVLIRSTVNLTGKVYPYQEKTLALVIDREHVHK